jgi:hypothetical protein
MHPANHVTIRDGECSISTRWAAACPLTAAAALNPQPHNRSEILTMTVPTGQPAHDAGAMLAALLDEGYRVTLAQSAGNAAYYADLLGPLGSQATGYGDSPAAALASAWPLDADLPEQPGPVDATAAAVLAGKLTTLREYVGRVLGGEHRDAQGVLERVSADLGRISVILAAATEGEDDDLDDAEPFCVTCGNWIGMFHGLDGWQHFTGDPAPGGRRELHDADHDADPAWTIPAGRSLSPADMRVIRQALADAAGTGQHAGSAALLDRLYEADR